MAEIAKERTLMSSPQCCRTVISQQQRPRLSAVVFVSVVLLCIGDFWSPSLDTIDLIQEETEKQQLVIRDRIPPKREWKGNSTMSISDFNQMIELENGDRIVQAPVRPEEDPLFGKSCAFEFDHLRWRCRDCGLSGEYSDWHQCPAMPEIGKDCPTRARHIKRWDWNIDEKARIESRQSHAGRFVNLLAWSDLHERYEQIPCRSFQDCWNLERCTGDKLSIYAYGKNTDENESHLLVDKTVKEFSDLLIKVDNPADACILVVTCDSFDSIESAKAAIGDGSNHFVFACHFCYGGWGDQSFHKGINFGKAVMVSPSFMEAQIRKGFDIPIALVRGKFQRYENFQIDQLPQPDRTRNLLLSFKGQVMLNMMKQIWWQHRWLAYIYWPRDPDILLDVDCFRGRGYSIPTENYTSIILDSTFVFCAGGGSVNSYRFAEVLGLGAIPVVTEDYLPPMWPEYDWSNCIVQVTESRVVDLPRILRGFTEEEIRSRQRRCKTLFDLTIGWVKVENGYQIDFYNITFPTAMHLLDHRIRAAKRHEREQEQLEIERMSSFTVHNDKRI